MHQADGVRGGEPAARGGEAPRGSRAARRGSAAASAAACCPRRTPSRRRARRRRCRRRRRARRWDATSRAIACASRSSRACASVRMPGRNSLSATGRSSSDRTPGRRRPCRRTRAGGRSRSGRPSSRRRERRRWAARSRIPPSWRSARSRTRRPRRSRRSSARRGRCPSSPRITLSRCTPTARARRRLVELADQHELGARRSVSQAAGASATRTPACSTKPRRRRRRRCDEALRAHQRVAEPAHDAHDARRRPAGVVARTPPRRAGRGGAARDRDARGARHARAARGATRSSRARRPRRAETRRARLRRELVEARVHRADRIGRRDVELRQQHAIGGIACARASSRPSSARAPVSASTTHTTPAGSILPRAIARESGRAARLSRIAAGSAMPVVSSTT